jgi:L-fuconolactonase
MLDQHFTMCFDMPVVDSHCHASRVWFQPVETLLHEMDRNAVEQAVLVQMMGEYDNSYQEECVRSHPGRFASVVLVDVDRSDASRQLERLAERGASGVRLPPGSRSPGDDPLAIWRTAERLGLTTSCLGSAAQFASAEFARTIEAVPRLPIVLEHLGSVNHPDGEPPPYTLRKEVFALARYPNVYMKVPGLGEFAQRRMPVQPDFPFEQPIPPLLDLACEAFGTQRLMWGSDFPPVGSREGYGNALRLTRQALAGYGDTALDSIFGALAARLFPVRGGIPLEHA